MQSVWPLLCERGEVCEVGATRSGDITYLRKPKGAQAVIYTLAGHPQSSAWCVMTCNHAQSFGVASLFVSLLFFSTTPISPTLQPHGYMLHLKLLEAFCFML